MKPIKPRKIIHIDMDCFYAAIEIRDHPALAGKPVAVGGPPHQRGVLCTCNYIARRFGVRSAMPTATALRQCNELIVLPINMAKYRQVAKSIHQIFRNFSDMVEPLALDEAYIDVTGSTDYQGSATLIADAIRKQIWKQEQLTASAGVAPNKFLAKIASGWNKPNGMFIIRPEKIDAFLRNLAVDELYGVGKVNAKKLQELGIKTCGDLQQLPITQLIDQFGKLGQTLYYQCRGMDERLVEPNRIRKSLSVERTFIKDISSIEACLPILHELFATLCKRIQESSPERPIKNQYIKIKFNDFKLSTAEVTCSQLNIEQYLALFKDLYVEQKRPIRLLGLGVHFQEEKTQDNCFQQSFF